jgi:hypothetical protein
MTTQLRAIPAEMPRPAAPAAAAGRPTLVGRATGFEVTGQSAAEAGRGTDGVGTTAGPSGGQA